jgi:hypothetical protein
VSTITLERPAVITAAPLTTQEENALIGLSAASEKPNRVRSVRPRETRGWSLGGNVD